MSRSAKKSTRHSKLLSEPHTSTLVQLFLNMKGITATLTSRLSLSLNMMTPTAKPYPRRAWCRRATPKTLKHQPEDKKNTCHHPGGSSDSQRGGTSSSIKNPATELNP